MCPTINIPNEVYDRLAKHAEGFDTPANVIAKLLNHYEGIDQEEIQKASTTRTWRTSQAERDFSQYIFNGETYGKGRLALAIVKRYVSDNPSISFEALYDIFPKELQVSYDVIVPAAKAFEVYENSGHKRHYIKKRDLIELTDETIAVTNQWGSSNIDNMLDKARELGYQFSPAYVCPECGHQFKGNTWGGIDAHWKANHEDIMPYEKAWPLIQSGEYSR